MTNCYFYSTVKDKQVFVVPLCLECKPKFPNLGWFWDGEEKGYGPFLFKCEKCGAIIFDPEKEDENATAD